MKFFMTIAVAALLLCGMGCIFEPYSEVAVFDPACPQVKNNADVMFFVAEFSDLTGCGGRMLTRMADGRVAADPLSRWYLPPGELVPRALNAAFFRTSPAKEQRRISGRITDFACDETAGCFVLGGSWGTNMDKTTHVFRISEPLAVRGVTGKDIAAAAGRAIGKLAVMINSNAVGRQGGK